MKVFEDFVVESHLIAADRTPISRVKREHDRLTAEFAQRKPLIRCASQGEIGRFRLLEAALCAGSWNTFLCNHVPAQTSVGRGIASVVVGMKEELRLRGAVTPVSV